MSHAALATPPAAGPSGPDFPPASTPERSHDDDPFQFLDADKLEDMRKEKKRILTDEQSSVTNKLDAAAMDAARARAEDRYDELYKNYLLSFEDTRGLDEDDPKYEEYINYVAQVGNMSDTEWRTGEYIDGEKVNESGRDMIDDLHDHLLEEHKAENADDDAEDEPEPAPTDVPPVIDEATTELPIVPAPEERRFTPEQVQDIRDKIEARGEAHANLVAARNRLAELTVKRQGKLGGKANEEFTAAQQEYQQAMIAYAKAGEAMLSTTEDSRSDVDKRKAVVDYLLHEAAALRMVTNEKWNNTTVNKICAWMARGNIAQRVLKGVAVGAGVSAAAAAVGAVTGGTGLLTIAGAGAAGARLLRAYGAQRGRNLVRGNATTDMTGVPGATMDARRDFLEGQRQEMRDWPDVYGTDAILLGGSNYLLEEHEKHISAEHKKNRRAAVISMGAIVLPATGITVLEHTGLGHAITDRIHDFFGGGNKTTALADRLPATNQQPGTGAIPGTEGTPTPPTSGELLQQLTPEQLDALNIKPGEGGVRLMESLGGKPSDWYKMQDDLLKAHPKDFYRMPDGNVGLAHTGRLSNDSMLDIAKHMGYIH